MRKFIDIVTEDYSSNQLNENHQGRDFKGSKYEETKNLDIKDIAKLVRKDIIGAMKNGSLPKPFKASVKISRFSGGVSLDVTIKQLPDGFKLFSDNYLEQQKRKIAGEQIEHMPYYKTRTKEIQDIEKTIKDIVEAYNYDNTDVMVDYFDVNFYGNVDIDYELEKEIRNRQMTEE